MEKSSTRLDENVVYIWELNDNNTRYEYPRATQSDLRIQWIVLSSINMLVFLSSLLLISSILASPRARSKPFHLYIVFIAIPDLVGGFCCFLTCAMSAANRSYYSERMCGFQAFYMTFLFSSNTWLNGIVVPPTPKQVTRHACMVYLYCIVLGLMTSFANKISWLPLETHLYYGALCNAMEYDRASALFYCFVHFPLTMGIPIAYAIYATVDIFRSKLLPPVGLRRELAIFLMRLVLLFFLIWVPFLTTIVIGNFIIIPGWIPWFSGSIAHFQGFVTVLFCMTNKELREAMVCFLTCRRAKNQEGSSSLPAMHTTTLTFKNDDHHSSLDAIFETFEEGGVEVETRG